MQSSRELRAPGLIAAACWTKGSVVCGVATAGPRVVAHSISQAEGSIE